MVNCSNRNCNIMMAPDYFIVHNAYEKLPSKPINKNEKYEKYEKILDGFIKMELFCITCCMNFTDIICNNSIIEKKNYSIGYTHNLQK